MINNITTFCINLPTHKDRWEFMKEECSNISFINELLPISATPPTNNITIPNFKFPKGELGVSLSQVLALTTALNERIPYTLILEDDVKFTYNANEMFDSVIAELPSNWDILFLGGKPLEQTAQYSEHLYNVQHFVGAFAYLVPFKSLYPLLKLILNNITVSPLDRWTSEFAKHNNGFCIGPPICLPLPGHSVIRSAHRDYSKDAIIHWNKYVNNCDIEKIYDTVFNN